MPLSPRVEKPSRSQDATDYDRVLGAISDHRDVVASIDLHARDGTRGRFKDTGLAFDVLEASKVEDPMAHDETPEEIADKVIEMAEGYEAENGAHVFQMRILVEGKDGSYRIKHREAFRLSDLIGGSLRDETQGEEIQMIKTQASMIGSLNRMVLNQHRMQIETLQAVATMANPHAQVMLEVEKMKIQQTENHADRESNDRHWDRSMDVIERAADPLIDGLHDMWGDMTSGKKGKKMTNAQKLTDIFEGEDMESVKEIVDNEDIFSLLDSARSAPTDEAFKAIIVEYSQLAEKLTKEEKNRQMLAMANEIGMDKCKRIDRLLRRSVR